MFSNRVLLSPIMTWSEYIAQEAAKMTAEVLDAQRRVRGEDHDSTVSTAENLAIRLGELGQHAKAEVLLREV